MADFNGHISVEGLENVLRGLEKADRTVRKAAFRGLQAGGLDIINEAKGNLRENMSVVTNLLRSSGKVQKTGEESLDVGFFDTQNKGHGYAAYVEYGRRAGKWPPIDEMAQWVRKKFRIPDEREARSIGFLVARKIGTQGSTPHPFFWPAVEKCKTKILDRIRDAVRNATNG